MQVKSLYPHHDVAERPRRGRISAHSRDVEHMTSLLLKNGYVITVNPNRDVIREGWIRIEGDRIRGIGPMQSLPTGPVDG